MYKVSDFAGTHQTYKTAGASVNNNKIRSTCPYCGVGCGLVIDKKNHITGDTDHPANYGKLCAKGSNLAATISPEQRLLAPQINQKLKLNQKTNQQSVSWDQALDQLTEKLRQCIDQYGPESVAFYGSGQMLTEDYYVANKLMKGFIGSSNIDTNSRLCIASAVVAHQRAFGEDCVTGCYDDFELADLIILVGSNAAWTHPIIYRRIIEAKQNHPYKKLVVIDPRETASCAYADLHLKLKSDGDIALFNGLLCYLKQHRHIDQQYIDSFTEGFNQALITAEQSADLISQQTGINQQQLKQFFELFASTEKTVTAYCMGVNQSQSGSDKANAIINCHLATGRVGKPGASPFSLTGQPNAMGGREVGGLANQLAAHMSFTAKDIDRVARFWQAPNIARHAGLKAIDMFDAIDNGKIKFLWVMASNPAVSLPESAKIQRALQKLDCLVVSDKHLTETAKLAYIILPATGWGEKNGTVTNSERMISRQSSFITSPEQVKPDWWAICQIAKRLGFTQAFNYQSPAEIFKEHCALTAFENRAPTKRFLNLAHLAGISSEEYDQLTPIRWPNHFSKRLFSDGEFATPSKKAQFIATPNKAKANGLNETSPLFILNTGRERDQWHTRSVTGQVAKLNLHRWQPVAYLHPDQWQKLDQPDFIKLSAANNAIHLPCQADPQQRDDAVFVAFHWGANTSNYGNPNLLSDNRVDPYSGQPACKSTKVSISHFTANWHGWLASREQLSIATAGIYWNEIKQNNQYLYRLFGTGDISQALHQLADYCQPARSLIKENSQQQQISLIKTDNTDQTLLWLQLESADEKNIHSKNQPQDFYHVLTSAQQGFNELTTGSKIVCSCFEVSQAEIKTAIDGGCQSQQQVSDKLGCGNNCGVCKPEIIQLVNCY